MMFARQFIHLTRSFSTIIQPSSTVNKSQFLRTLNTDNCKRFCSGDCKTGDDEDPRTKLIKMELENLRYEGQNVPDLSLIKAQYWTELLRLNSKSARLRYYHFIYVTQKKQETENVKKQQRALAYAAYKEQRANEDSTPRPSRFLLRILDSTVNRWRNQRLYRAMQFAEKIVYDCSYDQYMSRQEAKSAAKQLMHTFAENRRHKDPFDLHFCNVNFSSHLFESLQRHIPTMRDKSFPMRLHECSYLDVFPKDKLVYLTPHCKEELTDYDPDAIYIIGAMVDTKNHEPLSMMKAKELGVKMAKLPLERYLHWGLGDKTLTLDQMMKIMLEWRSSDQWEKALEYVPKRKVMNKEVDKRNEVRKWTATANKFKTNHGNERISFDSDSTENDLSGLSTAEKFKRKIVMNNQLPNKFERSPRPNFDARRTDSMAESSKFKKFSRPFPDLASKDKRPDRTSSKSHVDLRKLLDK